MSLHVLVINLDNIGMTRDCVLDLMRQRDMNYDLTLVDNASTEPGTKEFFDEMEKHFRVWRYDKREPLNWIWNRFYRETDAEYLCYLNNDVRLPYNFIETIVPVFEKEPDVAIVGHVSNNKQYSSISDELEYRVFHKRMRQGWDFTIRRANYLEIPEACQVYFGDDILYNGVYDAGKNAALILNAPIIHYLGSSVKSISGHEYGRDRERYLALGYKEGYSDWSGLSFARPKVKNREFFAIKERPSLTINIVSYERHEQLRRLINMFLAQTDKRFVLDIWNDGIDSEKLKIIYSFCDPRIRYRENSVRANKYGHDMRQKSLMECKTKYWCTTNDDNSVSPYFVEKVLKNIVGYNGMKVSVAMENIPVGAHFGCDRLLFDGVVDRCEYDKHCKALDVDIDICGDVDAASFVVCADHARQIGGWDSCVFEADWVFWEKFIKSGATVRKLQETLVVHR